MLRSREKDREADLERERQQPEKGSKSTVVNGSLVFDATVDMSSVWVRKALAARRVHFFFLK